jgi:hypothetical protein
MRSAGQDTDCQKIIISPYDYQIHSCLNLSKNKPQINADERRFVNFNIQRLSEVFPGNSLIKSSQSTQRSQSATIPATGHEKASSSRRGTRMTRIARIFTDQRAHPRHPRYPCSIALHLLLSVFIRGYFSLLTTLRGGNNL